MCSKMIKPYIEVDKKEILLKLNFLTGLTMKDICNDLLNHAVDSNYAIFLTPHFKRSAMINKIKFPAEANPVPFPELKNELTRINLQVDEKIHEYAHSLYFATDVSVPKILASMLNYSINDSKFFDNYVSNYLSSKIDEERKQILRSILMDVNEETDRKHNIGSLLFCIADEVKAFDETLEESIDKLASRWTVAK